MADLTRSVVVAAIAVLAVPAATVAADPAPPPPDGAALYQQHCASCHDSSAAATRAPAKAILASKSSDAIVEILTTGAMAPMAKGLGKDEIDAIATHLTGKAPSHAAAGPADGDLAAKCKTSGAPGTAGPAWNGWSPALDNGRFQPTGLKAADVPRLKVKWAFEFPGGVGGQPSVVGGRVYFGSGSGRVYALDAKTGCMHWRGEIKGGIRGAATVGPLAGPDGKAGRLAVFVGDRSGGMHALDAADGQEIWFTKIDTHPFATVTGSPVLHRGRLYVPMSSSEEISTYVKDYRCCTFRGSVTALDAASGKQLWKTFTIADEPKPFRDSDGVERLGPAGGAIWSAPTVDPKRGVLYVATGDSYTDAPNTGSDAIVAIDLVTGKIRWNRQITENDNYLVGCTGAKGQPAACPQTVGPDHDFGASPILRVLPNGQSVLMAGQKSSAVTALDPDHDGAMLWQVKLGHGGPLGGIEWGIAADRELVFAPVADLFAPPGKGKPGMYALRIADGHRVWAIPVGEPDCKIAPKGSLVNVCTSALSAAATAIDGLAFEGSLDGKLRAYSSRDGSIAWEFDVGQASFQPVNASAPRKGSTMNGAGATVAGGTLLQISGYQSSDPKAMNVLLAFTVDGK